MSPISHTTPAVGVEVHESLDVHGGRSALRRLVGGLFDAWDNDQAADVGSAFAPHGVWLPEGGGPATGPAEVAAAYRAYRAAEPWTLHWLSNESLRAADGGIEGSWLWSAASVVEPGATSAWSGGDLAVQAVPTPEGWRVASLARTPRYRTPVAAGWLREPEMPLGRGAAVASSSAPASLRFVTLPSLAGEITEPAPSLTALGAEIGVRRLMGEHVHGVETGRSGAELAQQWVGDGSYEVVDETAPAANPRRAGGHEAVATMLDEQRAEESAWMRVLASEQIAARDDEAWATWRDLWTSEIGGVARWQAHQWIVRAVRQGDRWRFGEVTRRRLLDTAYGAGWRRATPAQHATDHEEKDA